MDRGGETILVGLGGAVSIGKRADIDRRGQRDRHRRLSRGSCVCRSGARSLCSNIRDRGSNRLGRSGGPCQRSRVQCHDDLL